MGWQTGGGWQGIAVIPADLTFWEMGAPPLSPVGSGRIYFDATANIFKVSENGGAYAALVATGTVTSVTGTSPIVSSGGATPAISLNLGVANSWTALQTFAAGLLLGSDDVLQWGNAVGGGTADVGLGRVGAASLEVNTGTLGALAALSALKHTITTGTITTSQPGINLTQTWNAAGVAFNGILFNATISAAAAGSTLMDLQANGTSTFKVNKGVLDGDGVHIHTTLQGAALYLESDNASGRNWALATNDSSFGDLVFKISGAAQGNPYTGTTIVRFASDSIYLHVPMLSQTANGYDIGNTVNYLRSAYFGTSYVLLGANAQRFSVKTLTELTTIAAAATTDTAIQLPANAVIFAVSVRVTTIIPTAATFTVTGATSGTAFQTGANVAVAAGTTDVGTKACPYLNTTAQSIRITPDIQPGDTTGRVRVTIHYYDITAATS